MEIFKNIITTVITSTVVSGALTAIITGFVYRNNIIFERKREAYTTIINKIIWLINNIPFPNEYNNYLQISENCYNSFKNEIEKYILYLNKNEFKILNNLLELFAKNVYIDTGGGDPEDPDYIYFDKNDLKQIEIQKNKLLRLFQKKLNI